MLWGQHPSLICDNMVTSMLLWVRWQVVNDMYYVVPCVSSLETMRQMRVCVNNLPKIVTLQPKLRYL